MSEFKLRNATCQKFHLGSVFNGSKLGRLAEVNRCTSRNRSNQCVELFIAYLYLNPQNIPERINGRSVIGACTRTGIKAVEYPSPGSEGGLRGSQE